MLVPIVVADVMATVFIYVRLMLLPLIVILADVIAMMCRCHITTNIDVCLADVIAKWQME